MSNYLISGIAKIDGEFKNIILNPNVTFKDKGVKELIYSTGFGEVEAIFGFADLGIVELEDDSAVANSARVFLEEDDTVEGIVFLSNGFLIITDLAFFTAFTRIDGKDTPYVSVESDTYEDDEAIELIESDSRLQ